MFVKLLASYMYNCNSISTQTYSHAAIANAFSYIACMHITSYIVGLQCHPSIPAMYHLIQQTDPSQPTKLMILGPSCSPATYLMGEIAQRKLNIPQVCAYATSVAIDPLMLQFWVLI